MICPTCSAVDVSGKFCRHCGAALPLPGTPKRRRWPWVLLGIVFALMTLIVMFIVAASIKDPAALTLSVVAAVIPAIVYSRLVLYLDRYEQEPRRVLIACFAWGAVVAVIFSLIAEIFASGILITAVGEDAGTFLSVGIGAPIIEETFKGIAILALLFFFRQEFDNVLDGLVYGALVGLGFAMTENVLYFGAAYLAGGPKELGQLFVVRAIIDGFGHALYTATTGAAVGWARTRRHGSVRFIVPVIGWGLAVFQHFLWNTGAAVIAGAQGNDATIFSVVLVEAPLFILPALIIMLIIAIVSGNRELEIMRHELAPEVASGVLTPTEYETVTHGARRKQLLAAAERRGGKQLRARQLHFFQTAADLAFRKYHLSRGESPKPGQHAPEDLYRQQLATLRAGLPAPNELLAS